VTPLLKARRGKEVKSFFNSQDYEVWQRSIGTEAASRWQIKYYKGLGTSNAAEAKEYFSNLEKHRIRFQWGQCSRCRQPSYSSSSSSSSSS
jgi:DNA topoisomerase-2